MGKMGEGRPTRTLKERGSRRSTIRDSLINADNLTGGSKLSAQQAADRDSKALS